MVVSPNKPSICYVFELRHISIADDLLRVLDVSTYQARGDFVCAKGGGCFLDISIPVPPSFAACFELRLPLLLRVGELTWF